MAQLEYNPDVLSFGALTRSRNVRRLLLLGQTVPNDLPSETLMVAMPQLVLPKGIYCFEVSNGVWEAMLVQVGTEPGPLSSENWNAREDASLIQAYNWMQQFLLEATSVPAPLFVVGQTVLNKATGKDGNIQGRIFVDDYWMYKIVVDGRFENVTEQAITAADLDGDPNEWVGRIPASAEQFAAAVTRKKLTSNLSDMVYAFKASRTLFRAYQYRPVIRFLESATSRLLIADEVGLGKTIEAGIVWLELEARQQAGRVIVVVPSMLIPKWISEMKERFGFDLVAHKRPELDAMLVAIENDHLPHRYHAIVSLETIRGWKGLQRMVDLDPRFDLVIVDEAHQMRNSNTASNTVGGLLSDWADALLFLTATPLNLGNRDLFNLLQLLDPGEFDDPAVFVDRLRPNSVLNRAGRSIVERKGDPSEALEILKDLESFVFGPALMINPLFSELKDILSADHLDAGDLVKARELIRNLNVLSAYLTRTRKSEVQDGKAIREPVQIDIEWTDIEREFYVAFEEWQKSVAKSQGYPTGFATQMPMRLASSCLPVARDKVLQGASFEKSEDDIDSEQVVAVSRSNALSPSEELVVLARALNDTDSKFLAFENVLRQVVADKRQALVFTFFKGTLHYLGDQLKGKFRVGFLHGDMDARSRHAVMRDFRSGDYDMVIATKVASEGLDFEFCSTVINYDLPWNPMEVEQRIGRIDRFGQESEIVYVINFHIQGTLESEIIERIHKRIGVFRDSIGDLEMIIADSLSDLSRVVFDFRLTLNQKIEQAEQILHAIEVQKITEAELTDAADEIAALDQADIAGMEGSIKSAGRYVGPGELVNFLTSWVERFPGATISKSADGRWVYINGTEEMCIDLERLALVGERLRSELSPYLRNFKDGMSVSLALDPDAARKTGEDILSVNHPLVRATVHSELGKGIRFAHCSVQSNVVPSGVYHTMLGLVSWSGAREYTELWATSIRPSDGAVVVEAGQVLLNAIAEGRLEAGQSNSRPDISQVETESFRRQMIEEKRRSEQNRGLVESRRVAISESFERKRVIIRKRIATAQENGNQDAVRLGESQLRLQGVREELALQKLENQLRGSLSVETFAFCTLEIL
jgi:superfamily II DNA or RNA helicase